MHRKHLLAALIAAISGATIQAQAYTVTVVESRPVTTQILPEMAAIQGVLG
ncbi:conjugal transfer protein, partial [Salmonella enterica subsp. houtenae serovar 44:z4,z23:-]|nr:conjugal transfer protein [Salmonella enterica subsp. houtenae serovar 44:z4,z23:-]